MCNVRCAMYNVQYDLICTTQPSLNTAAHPSQCVQRTKRLSPHIKDYQVQILCISSFPPEHYGIALCYSFCWQCFYNVHAEKAVLQALEVLLMLVWIYIWPSIVVLLILTLLLTPALWYWGYSVGGHWRMLDDDCKTGHNGQPCLAHLERFEHLLSFYFGSKWFCTQTILIKLENVSKQSCHQLLLLLILFSWVWSRYLQILELVQSDIWKPTNQILRPFSG